MEKVIGLLFETMVNISRCSNHGDARRRISIEIFEKPSDENVLMPMTRDRLAEA